MKLKITFFIMLLVSIPAFSQFSGGDADGFDYNFKLAPYGPASSAPTISTFSPPMNTTAAIQAANIVLTWSGNMNFATLTGANIIVHGSMTGPKYSTLGSFSNNGTTQVTLNPTNDFKPGELISVTVTGATSNLLGSQTTHATVYSFMAAAGAGSGSFILSSTASVGSQPWTVAFGDFNGDGLLDFAVVNAADPGSNSVSICLGNGLGGFSDPTNYSVGARPIAIALDDFNGDGILDFVTTNFGNNNVSIRHGDGSGGFGAETTVSVGTQPWSVALGDFNGDGISDIAVANNGSSNVSICLGNGSGGFGAASNFTVGTNPTSVAVGDFNGDGILDLATTNYGSNNVSILPGLGNGTFGTKTDYGVATPVSVAVGDFNGDGFLDIAVANNGGNKVSVRLGDGVGGFGSVTTSSVGSHPYAVSVGDFNGDGILDFATANQGSGNVSICLGDGVGGFSSATNYTVGSSPSSVALGDVNGDGILDLATGNYGSDNVSILLGNTPNTPPTISTSSTVIAFNEDSSTTITVSVSDTEQAVLALTLTATSSNIALIPNANITQTGATSATSAFTLTPVANGNGSANITITVFDGQYYASTTFSVTVNAVNDAPTISTSSTAVSFNEDNTTTITVSVADIDNSLSALALTATSSNIALIPDASIVQVTSTSATSAFTLTPVANGNGSANITITVFDGEYYTSTTFSITVNAVNDAPTISTSSTAITFNEDQTTTITVSVADIDNSVSALTLTATSSNIALIPDVNIVQVTSTSATSAFTLTPVANGNGSANITITVFDGEFYASTTFAVTVTAVNDIPTFSTGSNVSVNEDSGAYNSAFATGIDDGDPETTQTLTFWTTNDNTALFSVQPTISVTTGNLSFTPAANANGVAIVSVGLSDNGGTSNGGINTTATQTFTITVNGVNDAPTISTSSTAITFNEDQTTTITVSVADIDNSVSALTLTATSSNIALIPDANISQVTSTSATSAFTLTPVANGNGSANITITVFDGQYYASTTFAVTVTAVNDIPTFTTGANVSVNEDSGAYNSAFATGIDDGDPETTQTLTFWTTNDNNSLFSVQPTISVTTGNLSFTPASNQNGVAIVSVGLSDNGGTSNGGINTTATQTFSITVNGVNDAPTISTSSTAVSFNEDSSTTITVSVADIDNSMSELTLTATSSNIALIPDASIVQVTSTSATSAFTLTPVANGNGSANITITVFDGQYYASTTFAVTVTAVNDAPTISTSSTAITFNEDHSTTITVSVADIDNALSALTLTATSSNIALIPDANISQVTSTSATSAFTLTPVTNGNGTAFITITVYDGQYYASTTFAVTVNSVNDAPVFTTGANVTVSEDSGAYNAAFATGIGDGDPETVQTLTFSVSNDHTRYFTVQPSLSVTTGNLSFTLAPNANGVAIVTVYLSDNGGTSNGGVNTSATQTFIITINGVNDPPSIGSIANRMMHIGTTNTVTFTIDDIDTDYSGLTLTATSSNVALIANNGLTFSATSGTMTMGVLPTGNLLNGQSTITVSVNDGQYTASTTFVVTLQYEMQARKLIKLHAGESYTFTFSATDDQGNPFTGNIAVKDDVSSTQFSSHNFSNGRVSHTVTVPLGKAAGIYAVKFSADNLADIEYVEVLP